MLPKIVFIAPYKELGDLFSVTCRNLNKNIPCEIGDLQEGVKIASELEKMGIDAVISRGGTAIAIKNKVKELSVIEIQISGFDLIRTIYQAKQETNKIVIAGFEPFTYGIEELGEIMAIDIEVLTLKEAWYNQPNLIKDELRKIKEKKYNWLVGDNVSVELAKEIGMHAKLISSGKGALIQAICEAERVANVKRREIEKAKHLRSIIDFAYEGIISIDREGIIDIFNPIAEKIFKIKDYKIVGKNKNDIPQIMEILKNVELDCPEQGKVHNINGEKIVANIIPININNEIVRIVITFEKVTQFQIIEQKIRKELYLKGHIAENNFDDIITKSKVMQDIKQEAKDYAKVNSPIYIYGETGTGKELFAQAIHNESMRKNKPFVAFNCAALSDNLIESELFGYVEGAFTGALKKGKLGLFEQAHEGTIFLDEIGGITFSTQVQLLRVLQEGKIRRIGDDKITPIDVRIIVATNQELKVLVKEKKFREDLYYRINVLNLSIPTLREHNEDIEILTNFFIKKYKHKIGKNVEGISKEAVELLRKYNWPGNVRQLENVVERLIVRTKTKYITLELVKATVENISTDVKITKNFENISIDKLSDIGFVVPGNESLKNLEDFFIKKAINEENGNREAAAKKLGISRTTLWRKLKRQSL